MPRHKWDPLVLPWAPTIPRADVMERFRARVREHLAQLAAAAPRHLPTTEATTALSAAAATTTG